MLSGGLRRRGGAFSERARVVHFEEGWLKTWHLKTWAGTILESWNGRLLGERLGDTRRRTWRAFEVSSLRGLSLGGSEGFKERETTNGSGGMRCSKFIEEHAKQAESWRERTKEIT